MDIILCLVEVLEIKHGFFSDERVETKYVWRLFLELNQEIGVFSQSINDLLDLGIVESPACGCRERIHYLEFFYTFLLNIIGSL